MIPHHKNHGFFKRENAQTMVEFAIVFPVILLITYGLIEFGRMMFIYSAVTGAAREGARYGAAAGDTLHRYADCAGIQNAVNRLAILFSFTSIGIRYDEGPDGSTLPYNCASLAAWLSDPFNEDPIDLGDRIIVTVNAQYKPMIGSFLGVSEYTISSENARTILVDIKVEPPPPYP